MLEERLMELEEKLQRAEREAKAAEDEARRKCNAAGKLCHGEKAKLLTVARDHMPEILLLHPDLDLAGIDELGGLVRPWIKFSSFAAPELLPESSGSRHKVYKSSLEGVDCVLKEGSREASEGGPVHAQAAPPVRGAAVRSRPGR